MVDISSHLYLLKTNGRQKCYFFLLHLLCSVIKVYFDGKIEREGISCWCGSSLVGIMSFWVVCSNFNYIYLYYHTDLSVYGLIVDMLLFF